MTDQPKPGMVDRWDLEMIIAGPLYRNSIALTDPDGSALCAFVPDRVLFE